MLQKKLLMQILTDKTSQGKVFKVDEPVIVDNVRKSSIALSFPSVTCNVCDVRSIEGYEAINEHIISAEHKRQIIDAGPGIVQLHPLKTLSSVIFIFLF